MNGETTECTTVSLSHLVTTGKQSVARSYETVFQMTQHAVADCFEHELRLWQLRAADNRVATSLCRGHVDELATEPFLLLHREHGTGYRRSWNCCDRWTRFIVIWKHFCFILSTGTRIRTDSVMRPRSSSRGAIQVPQLQSSDGEGWT